MAIHVATSTLPAIYSRQIAQLPEPLESWRAAGCVHAGLRVQTLSWSAFEHGHGIDIEHDIVSMTLLHIVAATLKQLLSASAALAQPMVPRAPLAI